VPFIIMNWPKAIEHLHLIKWSQTLISFVSHFIWATYLSSVHIMNNWGPINTIKLANHTKHGSSLMPCFSIPSFACKFQDVTFWAIIACCYSTQGFNINYFNPIPSFRSNPMLEALLVLITSHVLASKCFEPMPCHT